MLKHLYVKNFTLIDELDIDFHPGFSVITGETGAGKSIILGAIHLLLGQRADTKQIKSGCKKCIVEAVFDLSNYHFEDFFHDNDIDFDGGECIIRREVNASGKSRAFINDTPVALNLMRELGEQLIDIHSQHQNLLLQKEDFQLNVVDIIAHNEALRKAYRQSYDAYQQAQKAYEDFCELSQRNKENEEFLRFQYSELSKANLSAGEQTELEQRSQTMSHVEDIKSALFDASNGLSTDESGCLDLIRNAADRLHSVEDVYAEIHDLADRLDSSYIELKDISQDLEGRLEVIDFDPKELASINERLDYLYALEQRFHFNTEEELIAERDKIEQELNGIDNGDERLAELKAALDQALAYCMEQARLLSASRQKAARVVESEMKKRLVPLGIPNVRFAIDFKQRDCSPSGIDKVSFLFSANSSSPLQPVSQVA
jgi:DNA repair protein RecN (Recombination protein N)